jgi:hypothetical protein
MNRNGRNIKKAARRTYTPVKKLKGGYENNPPEKNQRPRRFDRGV